LILDLEEEPPLADVQEPAVDEVVEIGKVASFLDAEPIRFVRARRVFTSSREILPTPSFWNAFT